MAFNPDQYLADKAAQAASPQSFNPDDYLASKATSTEEPGLTEAALRGAGQGASLGFEPAIAGGLDAIKKAVLDGSISLDDIGNAYKATRDSEKAANDAAAKAHPLVYGAGNVAGGVGTALAGAPLLGAAGLGGGAVEGAGLGSKLLSAAGAGAGIGAVAGTGDAVSSGKDLGDTALDALKGAGTGAIAGPATEVGLAGIRGLGNAASSLGDELTSIPAVQKSLSALKLGLQGKNTNSAAGAESAKSAVQDAAESIGMGARDVNKQAGSELGAIRAAKQANGDTVDASSTLEGVKNLISKLRDSAHPNAQKDADFYQQYLDKLLSPNNTANSPVGANPDSLAFDKANDIKNTLTEFAGKAGNNSPLNTNEAINTTSKLASDLNNSIQGSDQALAAATDKAKKSYAPLKTLGLDDSDFQNDPLTGEKTLTTDASQNLKNKIRQMGAGTDTQAGQNATDRLMQALDQLGAVDPDKAAALKQQVQDASEYSNTVKAAGGNVFAHNSVFTTVPVRGANIVGRTLAPAANSTLAQGAKSLLSTGSPVAMKLAGELGQVMTKDGTAKNAAMFALMQQPEYRALIKQHMPELSTDTGSNE